MKFFFRIINLSLSIVLISINVCAQSQSDNFNHFFSKISELIKIDALKEAQKTLDTFKLNNSNLDCNQKALLHQRQAAIYYSNYEDELALSYWRDSCMLYWLNCPDKSKYHYALTHFNLANLSNYLNLEKSALDYTEQAISLFDNLDSLDSKWYCLKLLDLAAVYSEYKDSYNAELILDRVISLSANLESSEITAKTYNRKCLLALELSEHEKSVEYGYKAIKLYQQEQDQFYKPIIICRLNIATSLLDLDRVEQALTELKAISKLYNNYNSDYHKDTYDNLLPLILKRQKKYYDAINLTKNRISQLQKENKANRIKFSFAYENLADIYTELKEFQISDSLYRKAALMYLPGAENLKDAIRNKNQIIIYPLNLIKSLHQNSLAKNNQYELTGDLRFLKQAASFYEDINIVFERERRMTNNEVRKSHSSNLIKTYFANAVKTNLKLYQNTNEVKFIEQAYKFASYNRSLLLREKSIIYSSLQQVIPDSLLKRETQIVKKINDVFTELNFAEERSLKDSLYALLIRAQKDYETYTLNIQESFPKYFNEKFSKSSPLSIKDIQAKLNPKELVLDFYFGLDSLYTFSITSTEHFVNVIPKNPELEQMLDSYRLGIENNSVRHRSDSNQLSKLLISKSLAVYPQVKKLIIIPDEKLLKIPFETLNHNDQYLVELMPISYLFSNLDLITREATLKEFAYLGFASSYSKQLNQNLNNQIEPKYLPLSTLQFTKEEIANSSVYWKGKKILNEEATKHNFVTLASQCAILQLALHGIVNEKHPERSAMIFDDETEDCILRTNELYRLELNNELVILSSCNSGDGHLYKAEGTQSLARGFVVAGAASIVSSLWAVYDESTALILSDFNKYLSQGFAKDKALQKAKIHYLKNAFPTLQSPKYWSNLVLYGNTNPIKMKKSSNTIYKFLGIIIILLIILYLLKNRY